MPGYALVTGSGGCVGSCLCTRLVNEGWDVVGLDSAAHRCQSNEHWQVDACDITNVDSVETIFKRYRDITHVFHLAAITFVPQSTVSATLTFEVNVNGTVNIIEAMTKYTPGARLIYVGSSEVYGPPQSLPVCEDHPLNPQNPYAISKLAADLYCGNVARSGLDIVRMRPFNHSGAGQRADFVLSDFAKQVVEIKFGKREPLINVGNLDSARDFSHVMDVVHAYILAAHKGECGKVYNVCSGKSIIIKEVLEQMIKRVDVEVDVEVDPVKYRPLIITEIRGSYSLLEQVTGWIPQKKISHIIDDLIEYWTRRVSLDISCRLQTGKDSF